MQTNKTYALTTIADLLDVVTTENLDALVTDIRGALVNAATTKAVMELAKPGASAGMFNGVVMNWTDDNVNSQSFKAALGDGSELEFKTYGKTKKKKS